MLGSFSVPIFTYSGNNDGTLILDNIGDYKQSYNGLDLAVRKRMSNNFMLSGSVVLQKQEANYDGGDAALYVLGDGGITPGTPFPGNPGNAALANGQPYAYAPGGSGKSGVYPYSEWQFKFSGVYQFPWDISVGAFARYQQGYPYVLWARTRTQVFLAHLEHRTPESWWNHLEAGGLRTSSRWICRSKRHSSSVSTDA